MDASGWTLAAEAAASGRASTSKSAVAARKDAMYFIKKLRVVWKDARPCAARVGSLHREARGLVASAENLVPRIRLCASGEHLGLLAHFVGAQDQLTAKLVENLEQLLSGLRACVSKSELLMEELGRFANQAVDLMSEASDELGVRACCSATPVSPSVADLVHGLELLWKMYSLELESLCRLIEGLCSYAQNGGLEEGLFSKFRRAQQNFTSRTAGLLAMGTGKPRLVNPSLLR